MDDPKFDPDRFRLPSEMTSSPIRRPAKPPRHRSGEKFLKGPIPWSWLAKAAKQPGKALHVAVALWFWAGVKRSRQVPLSTAQLLKLGANRFSGYRGLKALERVGLVSVIRKQGRHSIVTLLESPRDD